MNIGKIVERLSAMTLLRTLGNNLQEKEEKKTRNIRRQFERHWTIHNTSKTQRYTCLLRDSLSEFWTPVATIATPVSFRTTEIRKNALLTLIWQEYRSSL